MKRIIIFFLAITNLPAMAQTLNLQDQYSYAMFCNSTTLPIDVETATFGNSSKITSGRMHYLPWEVSNHHDFGNQETAVLLGVIFSIDPHHSESVYLSRCDRSNDFISDESYTVDHYVEYNGDTLFTVVMQFKDRAYSFTPSMFYNIRYPDGSLDVPSPGTKLRDNTGNHPQQANRAIFIDGKAYKLLYGSFDQEADPTDNVLFSLSELHPDNQWQQTPNPADLLNPDVLNVWTYNPGMLRPLDYDDNEESARAQVMHLAIPDNLDIIVFEEWFENSLNKIMFDSLKSRYPYYTTSHNQPWIPNLSKDGGVRIMSSHPILEEGDISYQSNGCIADDLISALANKGVKYVKINKHGQIIHVFGTHSGKQPCDFYIMGQFIHQFNIQKNDIVVLAGDFNVTLDQFDHPGFNIYEAVLDTLNAIEPTYNSLTLDMPYKGTCWGVCHYDSGDPASKSYIDYVLTSTVGKQPIKLENTTQIARVHNLNKSFWGVFDLGDHNPVYGRMEFPFVNIYASDTIVCPGDNFTITARTNLPGPVYDWYKNDTLFQSSTDSVLQVTGSNVSDNMYSCKIRYSYMPDTNVNKIAFDDNYSGPYIFRGKFESIIEDDVRIHNCTLTGINNHTQLATIYPNPANDFFRIDIPSRQNELLTLKIFSTEGVLLKVENFLDKEKILLNNLSAGIYLSEITAGDEIISYNKIVILH